MRTKLTALIPLIAILVFTQGVVLAQQSTTDRGLDVAEQLINSPAEQLQLLTNLAILAVMVIQAVLIWRIFGNNSKRESEDNRTLTMVLAQTEEANCERREQSKSNILVGNAVAGINTTLQAVNASLALILANQSDAVSERDTLLNRLNTINANTSNWHQLIDDDLAGLKDNFSELVQAVRSIEAGYKGVVERLSDEQLKRHMESVLTKANHEIMAKLDELAAMIRELQKPTPTPPGQSAEPPSKTTPLNADGAKNAATVDFTPDELPRTGTDG